jgi:uncharacterized protein YaaW (UPF0174 family)
MDEGEYEKFKRHIGRPVQITLDGEMFEIKRFNFEQTAAFLYLSGKFEKKESKELSKEDLNELMNLLLSIIRNSYPKLDEETAKEFVANNYLELMESLPKILPTAISAESAELMKKRMEEYQKQNAK